MSFKNWHDWAECRHCVNDRKFDNTHEARQLQTEKIIIIIIIIINTIFSWCDLLPWPPSNFLSFVGYLMYFSNVPAMSLYLTLRLLCQHIHTIIIIIIIIIIIAGFNID